MLLPPQESDDAHVSRRYFLGKTHVSLADSPQPPRVKDHHALQALDGAQDREYFIEPAAYLVEEAQLDLIQPLLHAIVTLARLLPVPYEQLAPHRVPRVEVHCGHPLVALLHHLRLQRGRSAGPPGSSQLA